MKSSYKRLGDYIQETDVRDRDQSVSLLLGVSVQKCFIPSIANTVGTDMSTYKIVKRNQFTYIPDTSRRGDKIGIALLEDHDVAIVSQAYSTFKIVDEAKLLPQYLMMWFMRPEFDRYARYMSYGSVREIFSWDDMCDVRLPIPSPKIQREIVAEYQVVQNRMALNQQLIQKLEETAQALYKQWFVDFEFPNAQGQPYKSSGGEMVESELGEIPKGWEVGTIGDYSKVKSGFAFKSDSWQPEGIPVIKIGSISNRSIDYSACEFVSNDIYEKAKAFCARRGDIVVAMTGATIGKIGIITSIKPEFLVNQRVGLFDLGSRPIMRLPFLYINITSALFQQEIDSVGGDSAQANVSGSQIESIKMIKPANTLVDSFNKEMAHLFNVIIDLSEASHCLNELSSLLLSKLATVEEP